MRAPVGLRSRSRTRWSSSSEPRRCRATVSRAARRRSDVSAMVCSFVPPAVDRSGVGAPRGPLIPHRQDRCIARPPHRYPIFWQPGGPKVPPTSDPRRRPRGSGCPGCAIPGMPRRMPGRTRFGRTRSHGKTSPASEKPGSTSMHTRERDRIGRGNRMGRECSAPQPGHRLMRDQVDGKAMPSAYRCQARS